MKKAMTVYVWVQTILTVFGALWALTRPESYGKWTGRMIEPMLKSYGLIEDEEK